MTPDEVLALSRISPSLAPYIVLAVPMMGVLAYFMPALPHLPVVRRTCKRLFGWDPGETSEDETSRRTMMFIDQLQEELQALRPEIARCRQLLDRYAADIDQLRQAKLAMLEHMADLRDAAIAARTQLHAVQRQFGVPETVFDRLPGALEEPLSPV